MLLCSQEGAAQPNASQEQEEEEAEGTFLLSRAVPLHSSCSQRFLFFGGSALTKCGQSIPLQKFSRLQVSEALGKLLHGGVVFESEFSH